MIQAILKIDFIKLFGIIIESTPGLCHPEELRRYPEGRQWLGINLLV